MRIIPVVDFAVSGNGSPADTVAFSDGEIDGAANSIREVVVAAVFVANLGAADDEREELLRQRVLPREKAEVAAQLRNQPSQRHDAARFVDKPADRQDLPRNVAVE